mmetsp:Transcript_2171/g.5493  ORF Transcript_2171/g.5493 Transcript_2171/m.5493 type:complete len:267 (-) Transcript_2171:3977-4777(-)
MKIVEGDLVAMALSGDFDVIVHGCNCFHTMGGGIANTIRNVFPHAYREDRRSSFANPDKLGTYTSAEVEDGRLTIVNGYTQFDYKIHADQYGRKIRNVDYHAVRCVFSQIKHDFAGKRIGYPKIGCGLAGGDWKRIAKIIDMELSGEDHTLVLFKPQQQHHRRRDPQRHMDQQHQRQQQHQHQHPQHQQQRSNGPRMTQTTIDAMFMAQRRQQKQQQQQQQRQRQEYHHQQQDEQFQQDQRHEHNQENHKKHDGGEKKRQRKDSSK